VVEQPPAAVRASRTLDRQIRHRIQGAIALLARDPRPPNARALQGGPGLASDSATTASPNTVDDDVLRVIVVRLGHRCDRYEAYRSADQT
jgi:mRNA interferase RelE/StbE